MHPNRPQWRGAPRVALLASPWLLAFGGEAQPRLEIGGRAYDRADVQANTFVASTQDATTIARDASGRTIAAWQSRRQEAGNYGIYAVRFDEVGARVGDEIHVNQYTPGAQTRPCVAIDAAGAAWFAWESAGQDGSLGAIVARRFDAELATATNEVIVNDVHAGHQGEVALACDPQGRAVIAWSSPLSGAPATKAIFARRLGPNAEPLGPSFRVDQTPDARASMPSIAIDAHGRFTIAWGRADLEGRPSRIAARSFDASGTALGDEFQVSADDGRMPVEPIAATNARGELVIAWMNSVGDDYAPTVRRLRWSGSAWDAGAVRELVSDRGGYSSGLDLALADDGAYALVWSSMQGADRKGDLWARIVDANDCASEPFRASAAAEGRQRIAPGGSTRRVVLDDDGRIATAWTGDAGMGDDGAACVSFLAPLDLDDGAIARATRRDVVRFSADEQGAAPHEPPIHDPTWERTREALIDFKGTAGPDFGFTGLTQTSLTPPDPHGAVGPNHYVQVVNDVVAFFTQAGTQTFVQSLKGSAGFFASVGAVNNDFPFDPEALFDPLSQRFMIMCNTRSAAGQAFFDLAVSDDSDPNGTWHKYRFNVTAAAGNDGGIDSPNIGTDQNVIYLSADFFSGGTKFLIFCVDKATCLVGGANPTTRSLLITGSQSYGSPVFYDASASAYYFLENLEGASNTSVRLHAIRNALTTPTDTVFNLSVPTYTPPEDPPQLGTTIRPEAFESRFWSATYRNGFLWGAQHTGNPCRARWYQIAVNGWPTSGNNPSLVQSGDIIPAAGVRTSFVSIAVDAQNNAACVFARSSPTEFLSMSRAFRLAGDPNGTMTPAVFMKQSTQADTSGRWGDYSACTPHPTLPKVWWGTHEYRTNIWSTWIGMFGPCDAPTIYCTAKVNSLGLTPQIGTVGEPAIGGNSFQLTMTNAVPDKSVIAFWGHGAQASSFFNGTLCVTLPIVRSPVTTTDGAGAVTIGFPLDLDEVGQDFFAQFWYRDPAHLDGTGVGLSNAVQFRTCP